MMDPKHRDILRRMRLELCSQGLADGLVPQYLFQEGVITSEQLEDITSQATSQRRAMKLLDVLPTRGSKAFKVFLVSLSEFPWIRVKLDLLCKESLVGKTLHLPNNLKDICPSDKQLSLLADQLGADWEKVLGYLGLDHVEIYKCKVQHPYSLHSQAMEGLVKWKQHMGHKATMQYLWEVLQAAEVHHSALETLLQLS
ncbi:death domain-containing protein CRADD-like [Bufo bufo]|uniref:death domain-containing protein CRADD-like n=1 Tax=Bufo bufo TaxID=8384 RepID=UPI001ABE9F64|nr:death domain-containing protein CRADD-like [Bufo bufo]XP_040298197.1 death domain-containing protein CRADD-like [Bufo bufo]